MLWIQEIHAAPLSAADRESLLENLEKLQADTESTLDKSLQVAISAYRAALESDQAAMALYLDCLEKVNFADLEKTGVEFREWKRKESDKLSESGLKLALRHQLRWLILTIKASPPNANRDKLASEGQEAVDAIFQEPKKLIGQEAVLGQSVLGSIFAKAYGIEQLKVEEWPLSPVELENIYNELLLPPLQNPTRLVELRNVWLKRILQEGAKVEFLASHALKSKDYPDPRQKEKHEQEMNKFTYETLPALQWKLELDLFRHGDEKAASVRMFAHLGTHAKHASVQEWTLQFKELLTSTEPKVATP